MVNARQTALKEKDALALACQASEVFVAKGKNVVHLDMKKDKPDKQTLTRLLLYWFSLTLSFDELELAS